MDDQSARATPDGLIPRFNPHWDEAALQQLHRVMSDAADPFERKLATIKLAASRGDFDRARHAIDRVIIEHLHLQPDDPHTIRSTILACLICQEFDLASQIVVDSFKMATGVIFSITGSADDDPESVLWEVRDNSDFVFHFSQSIYAGILAEHVLIRWTRFIALFAAYATYDNRQAGSVYFNMGDAGGRPGLVSCESRREFYLIPDAHFVDARGYEDVRHHYNIHRVPWSLRRCVALWRGGTTGQVEDAALGWRSLPRVRLCQLARSPRSRGMIDAGFTAVVQMPDEVAAAEVERSGLMRPYIPTTDFGSFKYLIDVDGNSNSWDGLFHKLLSGSTVLKVHSPLRYRQWYYDRLRPWINHVPVASDLSDLIEKIEWLAAHDDIARRIGENGRELAMSLDFVGEIGRAGRIITAAIRHSGRMPEMEARFGSGEHGNAFLGPGWSEPEAGGVCSDGFESRLLLARPVATADFDLKIDVSPLPRAAPGNANTLVVVINGRTTQSLKVAARQWIRCSVLLDTMQASETLAVTLLSPDAATNASAERPFDNRLASIVMHGLSLTPVFGGHASPDRNEGL